MYNIHEKGKITPCLDDDRHNMDRFVEGRLDHWLHSPYRKPLVIRGARQVGKSTLVRQFAEKQKLKLHEINLERHLNLTELFETHDIQKIVKEIELICRKGPILEEEGLLFLDEIQAISAAIQTLRYFYEEHPKLPVIAVGSLLEFAVSRRSFSMPVGRIEYLYLGPMAKVSWSSRRQRKIEGSHGKTTDQCVLVHRADRGGDERAHAVYPSLSGILGGQEHLVDACPVEPERGRDRGPFSDEHRGKVPGEAPGRWDPVCRGPSGQPVQGCFQGYLCADEQLGPCEGKHADRYAAQQLRLWAIPCILDRWVCFPGQREEGVTR